MVKASAPAEPLAFASAPRDRSSFTFSTSGAPDIKMVTPFLVLLFGSTPLSNSDVSSFAEPNNAVLIHDGTSVAAPAVVSALTGDSGSALRSAITAQQLPAYE